ncbi:MAG: restriction endonuclease, partial [Piscirickettsiaceae bacterium CG_4_10_14_0_2_um_filter_44_336]
LTGEETFYEELIHAIAQVAVDANFCQELESIVTELAATKRIQDLSKLS